VGCRTFGVSTEHSHRIGSEERSPISHKITNIAYTVSMACQFMHDPRAGHIKQQTKFFCTWIQA